MIMKQANLDPYLTTKQVADLLGVKVVTIRRYIQSGKLPAVQLEKEFRISKKDLEEFLNKRKVKVK